MTDGDWSVEGHLITCSSDKMLTVSNHQGDTPYDSIMVKAEPRNIRWSPASTEAEKFLCCIIGKDKLCHINPKVNQSTKFIEFDKSYGKLSSFEWLNGQVIFITFESGVCAVVSMEEGRMGTELKNFRPHFGAIEAFNINYDMEKIAIAS